MASLDFPWKATAIGKSATSAKTFLEKRYKEDLELEDAVHIALLTLKETIEGEMNGETVEIGITAPSRNVHASLTSIIQASSERLRTTYSAMMVSKEQSDLGFES